jgi:hypothetical protein
VLWALTHLSPMMATAQLGITVSSLVLGAVAEPALAHLLEPAFDAAHIPHALIHPVAFAIALTLATYLHMLIGEMVPKNIALAAPERTALLLGPPLVATRAMSLTFAGPSILNGFEDRLILPVATVVKAMPSAGATSASSPSGVPIQRTSSVPPRAANRACNVRIAVRAG